MGEYIKYRGREVKIGTCEDLYYTSYEKYITALNSGFLTGLEGNGHPRDYIKIEYDFRFRFPFPDEDKLKFGEIIEPFNRGIPVTVSSELFSDDNKGKHDNVHIDIVQQNRLSGNLTNSSVSLWFFATRRPTNIIVFITTRISGNWFPI